MIQFRSDIVVSDNQEHFEDGSSIVSGKVEVVNYNPNVPIVHLTSEQIEFLAEGTVIPHPDGIYYMQCFVYKRLGETNLFERHDLRKVDLAKVGLDKLFLEELHSSVSYKEYLDTEVKG